MNQEERQIMLVEKTKNLKLRYCKCGRMDCRKNHAICVRCGLMNNFDAIPAMCSKNGKTTKRHIYDF